MTEVDVNAALQVEDGGIERPLRTSDFPQNYATNVVLQEVVDRLDSLVVIAASQSSQIFTQASPSSTWIIVHNMNGHPNVLVVDSGGTLQIGQITYDSLDQVTVSFSAPFSGKAYLNL